VWAEALVAIRAARQARSRIPCRRFTRPPIKSTAAPEAGRRAAGYLKRWTLWKRLRRPGSLAGIGMSRSRTLLVLAPVVLGAVAVAWFGPDRARRESTPTAAPPTAIAATAAPAYPMPDPAGRSVLT